MNISATAKVQRNNGTVFRNIEETGMIMNPDDSSLHTLNDVACFIWEQLVEEISVGALVEKITAAYECSPEQANADLQSFLEALTSKRLVKVIEE